MKSHDGAGRPRDKRNDTRRSRVNRWVDTTGQPIIEPEKAVVARSRGAVQPACDELAVTCWCNRSDVWVPQSYPRRGLTRACGTSTCQPPTGVEYELGVLVPKGKKGTR